MRTRSPDWILYTARGLTALWAAFWTWFGIASGFAEHLNAVGVLMHTAPGLVFVLFFLLAWRWELPGGILLTLIAVLVAVTYPILFRRLPMRMIIPTAVTLALPPLSGGILYLLHWSRTRPRAA